MSTYIRMYMMYSTLNKYLYVYIYSNLYIFVYVNMHLVLYISICVQETPSESSWTLTSEKPSRCTCCLHVFVNSACRDLLTCHTTEGRNTTNQLGYASKEGT